MLPSRDDRGLRQAIVAACREMTAVGLTQGTSGNIGVRVEGGLLLTPSGLAYDTMGADDIVFMDWDGGWTAREGNVPSSEWRFHLDILKAKPEAGAVVHAHPPYCTILAIMQRSIPAIHYMIAVAGGDDIRCAPYAPYGTPELSRLALKALAERDACLLAHHGMIATGASLRKAMWLAVEVEALARQYHGCLQIGTPPLLPDAEIDAILKRLGQYGLRDRARRAATGDGGA
ncbi:class II aldolase/adducin family protein [Enterovirga rhinocerotis]|uniref:L-fuculose-phosphate aldolase n=1 Tax=Enterovirga rhinocerotis TaxID=1339210 RepID=A0A4R7BU52_9HYPH|nr:class II aldolase/adducin family protein [Enterovirga rhinocerotis]TDR88913.1 L-fuculose-phosphate aldolase [Enterovirga rhinocerotis]